MFSPSNAPDQLQGAWSYCWSWGGSYLIIKDLTMTVLFQNIAWVSLGVQKNYFKHALHSLTLSPPSLFNRLCPFCFQTLVAHNLKQTQQCLHFHLFVIVTGEYTRRKVEMWLWQIGQNNPSLVLQTVWFIFALFSLLSFLLFILLLYFVIFPKFGHYISLFILFS